MIAPISRTYRLRQTGLWSGFILGILPCLAACEAETRSISVVIGDVQYRVAPNHVISQTSEPRPFVRISDPSAPFDLVHDSRLARQPSRDRRPAIFGIADGPYPGIRFITTDTGLVACRTAPAPNGGCGFILDDSGIIWSVLFPESQLHDVASIRSRAVESLRQKRRS